MAGSTSETACPAGKFSTGGATACTPAPAGSYVGTTGAVTATLCAPGTYSSATGATSCAPADPGYFVVLAGSTSETACPAGKFSTGGATACTPAPAGSYVGTTGAVTATLCAPGTYSSATGATSCAPADPGYFVVLAGSTSETACPAGKFSTGGATACTPAPAGSYVGTTGAVTATLCAPGTYSSATGATSCAQAPVDYYDAGTGNTSATPCPGGTSNAAAGSTSCSATTALAYTGTNQVAIGSSYTPTASLTSPAASCESSQPVSFSLSADPLNGATGTYSLGASTNSTASGAVTGTAVSTSGWQDGVYALTVSYAGATIGATVCAPATTTASLAVTVPGQLAFGAGSYSVANVGPTTFGFVVALAPHGSYVGQLDLVTPGKWWFQANITSYGKTSSTQGLVGGTGSLYWWDSALNRGHGAWQLAKAGVTYTATANAATKSSAASFGATINYTPVAPQPTPLPNASPVALAKGGIVIG